MSLTETPEPEISRLDALKCLLTADELVILSRVDRLSNQERAVFIYLGEGRRNNDIASALSINPKTLKTYFLRIKTKLLTDNEELDLGELTILARFWLRAYGLMQK